MRQSSLQQLGFTAAAAAAAFENFDAGAEPSRCLEDPRGLGHRLSWCWSNSFPALEKGHRRC